MMKKYYKGFSTKLYEETGKKFDIYNVECVQEDLLNEIFTVPGERLFMPTFGTRIPQLTFEINDSDTINVIIEDLTKVFKNDPRVDLLNLDVFVSETRDSIVAVANLRYIEFDVTKDLRIEISAQ